MRYADEGCVPDIEDIRKALMDCPDFACVFNYLERGQLPLEAEAARRIVAEAADYVLYDQLLLAQDAQAGPGVGGH